MKRKTTAHKALLSSAISMLLCCAMLLGTTMAWFTATVESSGHEIYIGVLDIDLLNDTTSLKNNTTTKLFDKVARWEPNATAVETLTVVDKGDLAFSYRLTLSSNDLLAAAADQFEVWVASGEKSPANYDEITADSNWRYVGDLNDILARNKAIFSGEMDVARVTAVDPAQDTYTVALHMKESATGRDANGNNVLMGKKFNINVKLEATQLTAEGDSFNDQYDKEAMLVTSQAAAQAALDNAAPNTTIRLASGVDYGTLYLRPVAGGAATKEVDWVGNNYRYETYSCFENLTIIGAPGAVVDAIKIEGGTYYNTQHSQSATYPVMLSLIELKNVVIDGVTFSGKGGYDPQGHGNAINLSGGNIKVDGLTLKNCTLDNAGNDARLIYKTEATTNVHTYTYDGQTYTFSPTQKDITVTGCTFNGGYMGLELRETENVTITNNIFNVADRNILLPVNTGCTYSGTITITDNISNNAQERFVRADGTGDAVVVIKNNTITNYLGEDADYIKVTNGNNVTIDGNTITRVYNASSATELTAALSAANSGDTVYLASGDYTTLPASSIKAGTTIVCEEGTVFEGKSSLDIKGATVVGATFANDAGYAVSGTVYGTFKDCVFESGEALRWCYTRAGETTVFENCVIKTDFRGFHFDETNGTVIFRNCEINGFNAYSGTGTVIFENCTFGNDASNYNGLNIYANTELKDCTFNYVSGKTNFIDMEGTGKTLTITNCTATLDGAAANVANFVGGSKLAQNTVIIDGVTQ